MPSVNRIDRTFRTLRAGNRRAFIPYVMAGDPSLEKTAETVLLFARAGADIVELGIPFSDPLADGPTIQRAAERALQAGVTLRKVIGLVRDIRQQSEIPLVLMTYFNPVFKYGVEAFVRDAAGAGVDGVIVPDLPPEEAGELIRAAGPANIATIFLIAPTSTAERVRKITRASTGFIYYVSMTGITGAKLSLDGSIRDSLDAIHGMTRKPVAVGFGVSTPNEAAVVAGSAEGVIVGSAIVKRLHESPEGVEEFISEMRRAI